MGVHIEFRVNIAEFPDNSFIPDEDDDDVLTLPLGTAYFSGFTCERQRAAYGVDFLDCLSRDADGGGEEFGPADKDESHWYTPNWQRGRRRADLLLAKVAAETDPHRRAYDMERVPPFVALVTRCAEHPVSSACQVRILI